MLIDLTLATAPLWVVTALVARWEYLRKKHYEANVVRGQASIVDAQAAVLQEQARTLRIRNDAAERNRLIDPKALAAYVIGAVRTTLPPGTPEPPELEKETADRVAELTEKQLIPDVENFLDAPLVNVDIETTDDVPALSIDDDAAAEADQVTANSDGG
jgi:hypothetical protein